MGGRLDWLTDRPIAHRGLHDRSLGVVENTASAIARAIEHGFAVEIDVRLSGDGEVVVFHDDTLERLTEEIGLVSSRSLAELRRVTFRETADRIWSLDDCLELVAGRQALVVEAKSSFEGGALLADKIAAALARHEASRDRTVVESFDPRVIRAMRRVAPRVARGIVGEAFRDDDPEWGHLKKPQRFAARNLLHLPWTRPHFLSWRVRDLTFGPVQALRKAGMPVTTWTVRTPSEQGRAAIYADQMVFEGFLPQ